MLQPVVRLCSAAVEMLTTNYHGCDDGGDDERDGERRTIDAALRQGASTGPVAPAFREA